MVARTAREKLIRDIRIGLGGTIVDVELEQEEYDYVIEVTLDIYAQKSSNAMEESFLFLDVQPDVAAYTLPNEVMEVRDVYRRINGNSGGATIDPFSLAMTQNIYLVQNPGGLGGGGAGQLATYDFAMQYQELVGRMFGRDVQFSWNPATKKIVFHRRFNAVEQIGMMVYNAKPEEMLLADYLARPWIRSMAQAQAKLLVAQARSKFASFAGPQGGISMNGDALKAEAQAEIALLIEELRNYVDQHEGYGFVIG